MEKEKNMQQTLADVMEAYAMPTEESQNDDSWEWDYYHKVLSEVTGYTQYDYDALEHNPVPYDYYED